MKYPRLADGDWLRVKKRGQQILCCDCGLVHRLNHRVVDGVIYVQAFRDNRSTAAARRGREFRGLKVPKRSHP